ncbi:zonadhesin-like [Macrobrachium nipponense]|uniref:zonadhesin-like n=1 Tax=Macrobrachium nipponense TaxID=159736 RepID=UPI0030C883FD
MLPIIVGLVLILVANEVSTEPANGYPSYDYSAYNPQYPSYSWTVAQTPAYNPYGYQTYYPSTDPSQATQTGQPAYTYSSAYPSYPFYYPYPGYPYYPFYPTQKPSVEPQTSPPPPAGPVVWPTGKPKTTPRPAVWPTGSPTRPPSIPVWPTKKAPQAATTTTTTTTTKAPSRPPVKAETTTRSPKKLAWPTRKSASAPTTTSTERPETTPDWPKGPPKTGVSSVTVKWPTEVPVLSRGTTTPTGTTQTPAAQTKRTPVWPTRSPKLPQSPRRIPDVTPPPRSQVPVSRTGATTERPKGHRGKDRGGEPQRPTTSSRRKQKPKERKPKAKSTRIPTISPVTTPLPFIPDEDAEIILGMPTYVPLVKIPGLPSNSTDLEPKLPPVDQGGPSASHNSDETSNTAEGTMTNILFANSTKPAISTSTTYASSQCKRLCLDARGKRFCCEHGTGRCPPKPESCYVPLSDPIPRHRSKGQCLVDTQCAENFKCCLDYCEEEYYCTRVQFELGRGAQ